LTEQHNEELDEDLVSGAWNVVGSAAAGAGVGAGGGAIIGGVGAIPGAIIGGIGGAAYGIYTSFTSGMDRGAFIKTVVQACAKGGTPTLSNEQINQTAQKLYGYRNLLLILSGLLATIKV
jgi:hypothetical protein